MPIASDVKSGECECCPDCAGKPGGTIGFCEDDGCNDLLPPSSPSLLIADPAAPGGAMPQWCRPQFVPTAMLQDLLTVLIGNVTAAQRANLAAAIQGNIDPSEIIANLDAGDLAALVGLLASGLAAALAPNWSPAAILAGMSTADKIALAMALKPFICPC